MIYIYRGLVYRFDRREYIHKTSIAIGLYVLPGLAARTRTTTRGCPYPEPVKWP